MRENKPKSNLELIHSLHQGIQNKANFLLKLKQEIHNISPNLKLICQVANYREGILVLECASAAWATRINFERQALLCQLRKNQLPALVGIEVKVNPQLAKAEIDRFRKKEVPLRVISKQSAAALTVLAQEMPDNIALRLKNIAAKAK